ncbi:MAG: FixH family protein [Nitrospirae bacterium]|nr:FixH family protein [Nitrospirota bacterium]
MKLLLIVVSIIGLSAVIGAVVIGTRTFDGTVVDRPYERGLAYDAAHHEKEASGWRLDVLNPSFTTGKNDIRFLLTDRNGTPLSDVEIALSISRPSSKDYDKTYAAAKTEQGQYTANADLPLYGYWDAKVQVRDSSRSITFERTLFANQKRP